MQCSRIVILKIIETINTICKRINFKINNIYHHIEDSITTIFWLMSYWQRNSTVCMRVRKYITDRHLNHP